ncbi:MAG: polysaccharide deacetylase [Oscillatoriales cyanobacterium]|nr:MAG: polysaccharide deacetylase [Oscillatoriales cyanobacterium]
MKERIGGRRCVKTERQRQPRPVWPRPWLAHDRRGFVRCLGQQAAAIAGLLVALALLAYGLWYGAVLPVAHRWAVFGVRQVAVQERLVALTFDDGPQPPYTEQILQVLDRFQVRATFFEIGRQIDRYPALTQAVIQRGHELGNHSYSHRNLILRWPGEIAAEIAETDRRLRAAGVAGPIAVRPPLGKRWLILPYLLWRSQRTLAMWNVDSGDYDPAADVSALVQQVLTQVQPGSIVLMHDGSLDPRQSRDRTVAALAVLIPALRDRGYRLVTLQELLRSAQAHGWTASTQD